MALITSGLGYLKREGFVNFCRRLSIYLILEWWASLVLAIRYPSKNSFIVKDIQGSKMHLGIEDKGISRELALADGREKILTVLIQGELKAGDCVADVGANIGYYALMEARLVGPEGKVYAIEPVPHNVNMLESNIQLNNYGNIEVFQLAMGASDGIASLYLSDHPNWCSFYPSRNVIGEVEVTVTSLDNFLKDKRQPTLIRMDVEGYEYEILKGMSRILESNIPLKLFVEFHPDIMGQQRAEDFISILKGHDFQLKQVILEPNSYPPGSYLGWKFVEFLNKRCLKRKFGAFEMTFDDLLVDKPIMTGLAGDPALFIERNGN